jgi:hypothetical protein
VIPRDETSVQAVRAHRRAPTDEPATNDQVAKRALHNQPRILVALAIPEAQANPLPANLVMARARTTSAVARQMTDHELIALAPIDALKMIVRAVIVRVVSDARM